jgi:hypothetical protein
VLDAAASTTWFSLERYMCFQFSRTGLFVANKAILLLENDDLLEVFP